MSNKDVILTVNFVVGVLEALSCTA